MEKHQKLYVLFGILIIFNFALILGGTPSMPHMFHGNVQLIQSEGNVNAPEGANVSAYLNGIYVASALVNGSSYVISVSGTSSDNGKVVSFKIDGINSNENSTFTSGENTELHLTVDKTAPTITIGSYNRNPTNQSITVTATTNEGTLNAASHTFTTNGNFTFTATDAAGNSNSTTVTITNIDKTAPSFTKANNLTAYNNQSLSYDLIDVSESVTLSINANPNFNITSQGFIANATALSIGSHTLIIIATDAAGNSQTANIVLTIIESDQQYAQDENVTVGANTSDIVFNSGSSAVEKIIIPSTIASDKEINLDMSALLSSSNVSVGGDMILERQTTSVNYTATIFSGTVISGNSTWDGVLELPQVSTLTSDLGTVNTVIQMGSSQRLNFSDAVKVVLGGMTGKKALWSDSTGTYSIGLCSDATSTSSGSLASGECYLDDGANLIIWTYHFTKFGAYTPTSSGGGSSGGSSGGGGGGGLCTTKWNCTNWNSCVDGVQTRTCNYSLTSCKPTTVKPLENQTCILAENIVNPVAEDLPATEHSESNIRGITGFAVIGNAVASPVGIVIFVLIGLGIIIWIIVKVSKKKKSKKSKK